MSAAAILERLYRDGLKVRTDGASVLLSPRTKVTADVLDLVRQHKAAILAELMAQRAAAAGCVVRCRVCRHFTGSYGPLGHCGRFDTEAFADTAFEYEAYAPSVLTLRREKVEGQLQENPKLRLAADVEDAPLAPEPGRTVSIVVAVRTTDGVVSGELHAPRDRFSATDYFAYLREIGEPS